MKTAIIAVPRVEPHRPPPGAAIVARLCANLGHDVTAYDLNIKLFNRCRQLGIDYHGLDSVFDQVAEPTADQELVLSTFIKHWSEIIAKENYDYIMVSIFSSSATGFAVKFLNALRSLAPNANIIAGGMGVGTHSLIDDEKCFGQELLNQSLINAYIVGEAEVALTKYLNGESGPGINNTQFEQIENIEDLPVPDYSYFDLDEYNYLIPGQKEVFITSSRGCVRKCTYCDVERYWPKYRYRSGQGVADEIIDNYERFGVTRFYFTDSLVNGSLRVFADMCDKLANYKFDTPISWSGQFIFRQKKSIPKDHFATIAAAGGDLFYVGIETGSDRVRKEMGKNFTNEDADFQFEECSKNGIQILPLMFTGYITETLQDHYDNLAIFPRWQRYVADGTIVGVELGSNLVILPGSPVERMIQSHKIDFMLNESGEPNKSLWYAQTNPDLTIKERIRRKLEVHETAIKYAWPVWRQQSRLKEFKELIIKNNLHLNTHQKFFQIIPDNNGQKQLLERKLLVENCLSKSW